MGNTLGGRRYRTPWPAEITRLKRCLKDVSEADAATYCLEHRYYLQTRINDRAKLLYLCDGLGHKKKQALLVAMGNHIDALINNGRQFYQLLELTTAKYQADRYQRNIDKIVANATNHMDYIYVLQSVPNEIKEVFVADYTGEIADSILFLEHLQRFAGCTSPTSFLKLCDELKRTNVVPVGLHQCPIKTLPKQFGIHHTAVLCATYPSILAKQIVDIPHAIADLEALAEVSPDLCLVYFQTFATSIAAKLRSSDDFIAFGQTLSSIGEPLSSSHERAWFHSAKSTLCRQLSECDTESFFSELHDLLEFISDDLAVDLIGSLNTDCFAKVDELADVIVLCREQEQPTANALLSRFLPYLGVTSVTYFDEYTDLFKCASPQTKQQLFNALLPKLSTHFTFAKRNDITEFFTELTVLQCQQLLRATPDRVHFVNQCFMCACSPYALKGVGFDKLDKEKQVAIISVFLEGLGRQKSATTILAMMLSQPEPLPGLVASVLKKQFNQLFTNPNQLTRCFKKLGSEKIQFLTIELADNLLSLCQTPKHLHELFKQLPTNSAAALIQELDVALLGRLYRYACHHHGETYSSLVFNRMETLKSGSLTNLEPPNGTFQTYWRAKVHKAINKHWQQKNYKKAFALASGVHQMYQRQVLDDEGLHSLYRRFCQPIRNSMSCGFHKRPAIEPAPEPKPASHTPTG